MPVLLDFLLYAGRLTYLFFALPGLTLPKDPWNFRQAIQNRNRRCKVDTYINCVPCFAATLTS